VLIIRITHQTVILNKGCSAIAFAKQEISNPASCIVEVTATRVFRRYAFETSKRSMPRVINFDLLTFTSFSFVQMGFIATGWSVCDAGFHDRKCGHEECRFTLLAVQVL